jgi:hypothetical protein
MPKKYFVKRQIKYEKIEKKLPIVPAKTAKHFK